MHSFQEAMRRVITAEDVHGRSLVIIDGGPSSDTGPVDLGGLFEIWEDAASGPLDPHASEDLGAVRPVLGPRKGNVQVRWFAINPLPSGVPRDSLNAAAKARFDAFGGGRHIHDQRRHPAMHQTDTIDVICLIHGDASLILDEGETRLKPGQVVIQRGTHHAWEAHGGPALFLAVLIDRDIIGREEASR